MTGLTIEYGVPPARRHAARAAPLADTGRTAAVVRPPSASPSARPDAPKAKPGAWRVTGAIALAVTALHAGVALLAARTPAAPPVQPPRPQPMTVELTRPPEPLPQAAHPPPPGVPPKPLKQAPTPPKPRAAVAHPAPAPAAAPQVTREAAPRRRRRPPPRPPRRLPRRPRLPHRRAKPHRSATRPTCATRRPTIRRSRRIRAGRARRAARARARERLTRFRRGPHEQWPPHARHGGGGRREALDVRAREARRRSGRRLGQRADRFQAGLTRRAARHIFKGTHIMNGIPTTFIVQARSGCSSSSPSSRGR